MKADERRSHRLQTLLRVWKNTKSEEAVINKAMLMGVTPATAKDYFRTIKARYPNG